MHTRWNLPKWRHPAVGKLLATNILFFPLVCFALVLSALFESPLVMPCGSLLSNVPVLGTGIQSWELPLVRDVMATRACQETTPLQETLPPASGNPRNAFQVCDSTGLLDLSQLSVSSVLFFGPPVLGIVETFIRSALTSSFDRLAPSGRALPPSLPVFKEASNSGSDKLLMSHTYINIYIYIYIYIYLFIYRDLESGCAWKHAR